MGYIGLACCVVMIVAAYIDYVRAKRYAHTQVAVLLSCTAHDTLVQFVHTTMPRNQRIDALKLFYAPLDDKLKSRLPNIEVESLVALGMWVVRGRRIDLKLLPAIEGLPIKVTETTEGEFTTLSGQGV